MHPKLQSCFTAVIPAKAGIQVSCAVNLLQNPLLSTPDAQRTWVPAFAGMTDRARLTDGAFTRITGAANTHFVIPAKAGIQVNCAVNLLQNQLSNMPDTQRAWVPAFAGMTDDEAGMTRQASVANGAHAP